VVAARPRSGPGPIRRALAGYQKAALNGYREVANALIAFKLAECVGQRRGLPLVDASDLSRARYDSGLASYIEILTADQDLFDQSCGWRRLAAPVPCAELYRTLGGSDSSPGGRREAEDAAQRRQHEEIEAQAV
jgi:outer membrane protein TolC